MTTDADPSRMDRYCDEMLPAMLTDACGVDPEDAARVVDDVRHRTAVAARLDWDPPGGTRGPVLRGVARPRSRRGLSLDEGHHHAGIRNSRLEEVHADGPVDSGGIQAITTYGLGPLSHCSPCSDGNRRQRRVSSSITCRTPFRGPGQAWRRRAQET